MRVIFQWGNCPAHRLHSYHEDCKTKHDISHIFVVCLFDKHLKNNTDNRNNGRNGCRGQQLCDTAGPINIGKTKNPSGNTRTDICSHDNSNRLCDFHHSRIYESDNHDGRCGR